MSVRIDRTAIQRIMGTREMTGKALAEKMGISSSALSATLTRGTCSHISAARLADALGVAYEDVLKTEREVE